MPEQPACPAEVARPERVLGQVLAPLVRPRVLVAVASRAPGLAATEVPDALVELERLPVPPVAPLVRVVERRSGSALVQLAPVE